MEQVNESGLVRGIRRWDLVAVTINGVIGAGIFGLPSEVFGRIGAYSLIAFIACAIVVTLIVLCLAEVSSRYSATGGSYLYTREAFGAVAGFEVGWMVWVARLTAFAANLNLFVGYLSFFWPTASQPFWRAAIILFVGIVLTAVNILGVRNAAVTSNIFTIGKLIPIVLFISAGLFFLNTENYSLDVHPQYDAFSLSVLQLIYAFTGFEIAVIPSGEIKDPQRNLPMALLTAMAVVTLLYILIQLICIGTLPGLASSSRPLADASRVFLGSAGAAIISVGALISIVGNLNVILLAGSRLPFAMAERDEIPKFFAKTHKKFHTPHVSIVLTAGLMLALTLEGTFVKALTVSAIARLLAYGATGIALIVLRRRSDVPAALFKVPAGSLIALLSIILSIWLLTNSTFAEARSAAIAVLIGLLIYYLHKFFFRRPLAASEN